MNEYKRWEIPGKGFRYSKDGKMVSVKNIPPEEMMKFDPIPEVQTETPDKSCLFCGEHAPFERTVNLQRVELCNEHYYSETIGKIAQQLNKLEVSNAKG